MVLLYIQKNGAIHFLAITYCHTAIAALAVIRHASVTVNITHMSLQFPLADQVSLYVSVIFHVCSLWQRYY